MVLAAPKIELAIPDDGQPQIIKEEAEVWTVSDKIHIWSLKKKEVKKTLSEKELPSPTCLLLTQIPSPTSALQRISSSSQIPSLSATSDDFENIEKYVWTASGSHGSVFIWSHKACRKRPEEEGIGE